MEAIWKKIYPVGAIYISTVSTSPAILFGGTWQQIQGRFLLAAGGGYAAGGTGGAATHTLTAAELPAHSHGIIVGQGSGGNYYIPIEGKFSGSTTTPTSNTGGGGAHNNMPPYLVVYMWRRTS